MAKAMIVRTDPSGHWAGGSVSKLIVEAPDGYGCYSLEFADDVQLTTNLRMSRLGSRWFDEIDVFIGEALRHDAEFVALALPDEEVIRLLQDSCGRLGRHSHALDS